jgi:hypothetical protein
MNKFEKLCIRIADNVPVFWCGWLSGIIGIILGFIIGRVFFG